MFFLKIVKSLKRKNIILIAVLIFSISSCNLKNSEKISTFSVINKDFENSIVIDGIVEPISYTTVLCPMNVNGTITYLVEDGTYVKEGDIICTIEDTEQENDYDNLLLLLETVNAELSKKRVDLALEFALLEAQARDNDANEEIASLDSLQLQFASPTQRKISELELERASIERERVARKIHTVKYINQSEIKTLEINIQRLKNRLTTVKQLLASLTVRAPKSGLAIVSRARRTRTKLKEGDNVWGNTPLVIIPEISEMRVRMMVNETDFKQINENDSVTYSFDAMPGNWAQGKITKKLPVGQSLSDDSRVKFFEVEASMDSILHSDPEPGFTTNCRVFVNFVNDTIVVPQIAIFDEDSMKVVYVQKNKKFEMRQISTGLSSQKESVVVEGLRRGEHISLVKPPATLIKGKKLLSTSQHN